MSMGLLTLGSGNGLILTNLERIVTKNSLLFGFKVSNNEAKYEALVTGLKIIKDLEVQYLKIYNDSQLVIEQVHSEYEA